MADESASDSLIDSAYADAYERRIRRLIPGYDVLHALTLGVLTSVLSADAHLLVVGAGTGEEILRTGNEHPGWRFTAVDAAPEMLQRCRQRLAGTSVESRVEYVSQPLEALDAGALQTGALDSGNPFDAATSVLVSQFLEDGETKQRFFCAISDRLTPGAPLVVADLCRPRGEREELSWTDAWRAFLRLNGGSESGVTATLRQVDEFVFPASESELSEFLGRAGFGRPDRFFQAYDWAAWLTRKESR